MIANKGGRGRRDENSLRRTGWRPPLVQGKYFELVINMGNRPEFKDKPLRELIEAALEAFATSEELDSAGFLEQQ